MAELKESSNKKMMVENGALGLRISRDNIVEEARCDLRFPKSMQTFKVMSRDPSIAASVALIETLVRRVNWHFVAPEGYEDKDYLERVQFFNSCMRDMAEDFDDVINAALSFMIYGYSLHEKVFKVRSGKKGKYPSKYNDGLIGWAKLPSRSQDTIDKWYFDDMGRDLLGARQNMSLVEHNMRYPLDKKEINLPRNKFMLFKYDSKRGNPEGRSPLLNAYVSWKYKTLIEEFEAMGVSRDMVGMPVISLPPDYFGEDADEDKQKFREYCEKIINDLNANNRAGVIFPRFIDPETKEDLFKFELAGVQGGKNYDTDKIIKRYEGQILTAFLADVLKLGQNGSGSFALADSKTNTLAMAVEGILKQIKTVINRDLVPQTYTLNQWDDLETVEISYGDIEELGLEEISSFVQRNVSVGAMECDKELSNYLRARLRVPPADEDKPVSESLLPKTQSKSGEGMKTAGEGTSNDFGGVDKSVNNKSKG